MTSDINSILNQLPVGNSSNTDVIQLPIEAVDKLANELVAEYQNPDFRQWYCGVIYQFGFAQVNEWRRRASEGKIPGRLFSKYVRDQRSFRGYRGQSNG